MRSVLETRALGYALPDSQPEPRPRLRRPAPALHLPSRGGLSCARWLTVAATGPAHPPGPPLWISASTAPARGAVNPGYPSRPEHSSLSLGRWRAGSQVGRGTQWQVGDDLTKDRAGTRCASTPSGSGQRGIADTGVAGSMSVGGQRAHHLLLSASTPSQSSPGGAARYLAQRAIRRRTTGSSGSCCST